MRAQTPWRYTKMISTGTQSLWRIAALSLTFDGSHIFTSTSSFVWSSPRTVNKTRIVQSPHPRPAGLLVVPIVHITQGKRTVIFEPHFQFYQTPDDNTGLGHAYWCIQITKGELYMGARCNTPELWKKYVFVNKTKTALPFMLHFIFRTADPLKSMQFF